MKKQVFHFLIFLNFCSYASTHKNIFEHMYIKSILAKETHYTPKISADITRILEIFNIKSLLDAGCGDFNWMQAVDLSSCAYIGLDIVEPIIQKNKSLYQSSKKMFLVGDFVSEKLPKVDLIICRDCFVYFNHEDILLALENFKASGSRYLLTTIFTDPYRWVNAYLSTGTWRPINLARFPFSLPTPLLTINEEFVEMGGEYKDKSLALYDLQQITF